MADGPATKLLGAVQTAQQIADMPNLLLAKATLDVLKFLPKMPAARLFGDLVFQFGHTHPHPPTFGFPLPSVGPILCAGAVSVLINGLPAARSGDLGLSVWCGGYFPIFEIKFGSSHVFIGGARAARMLMDPTLHCLPDFFSKGGGAMKGMTKAIAKEAAKSAAKAAAKSLVQGALMTGGMKALEAIAKTESEGDSDAQAAADAEAAAAQAAADAVGMATMALQMAADAAAAAMGALLGKDPGVGFPLGFIMMGSPNVLIGGFPMVGWSTILKGLGKLLKPLIRKIQLMLPQGRLRNALCALTGHPVDIASGRMFTRQTDFEIEGRIPIRFERIYDTSAIDCEGALGWGWTHPYDQHLWESKRYNCLILRNEENRQVRFDKLAVGQKQFQPLERVWLERTGETEYKLFDCKDGLYYKYSQIVEGGYDSEKTALRLTEIFDRNGNRVELKHDGGNVVEIANNSGSYATLHYHETSGKPRLTEIRQHLRNGQNISLMKFGYNGDAELISAANRTYAAYTYQYENHLMTRETNRNNLSFHFEYDGAGQNARCIKTWGDGDIYERNISYFPKAQITKVKDGLGGETVYHYNDLDLVTKIYDAEGGLIQYEYGASGERLKETDELGRVRSFVYDEQLNCVGLVNRDGTARQIEFDGYCQPLMATDEAGGLWRRKYDERGNLIATINPLEARREYEYNNSGDLIKYRDPLGSVIKFGWTAGGQVETIERPRGSKKKYVRNERDFLSEIADEFTGVKVGYTYDDAGKIRRISEINRRGETVSVQKYDYDDQGNVLAYTDALGNKTNYKYSGFDRLAERIDALGQRRQFKYDRDERLIEIVNERGENYLCEYDLLDRIIEETGFDGAKRENKLNQAGEITYQKDALGREIFYRYDLEGRLISKLRSDSTSVKFAYDECGRMIGAVNGKSTIKLVYNAAWQITEEQQSDRRIETTYDLGGKTVSRKIDGEGEVTYEYDEDGNLILTKFNNCEIKYERDQVGRILNRQMPNGIVENISYNSNGRVSGEKVTVGGGRKIVERNYQWDARGCLTEINDSLRGTRRYEYDAVERLQKVERMISGLSVELPETKQTAKSENWIPPEKRLWQADESANAEFGKTREIEEFQYDAAGNLVERKSSFKGSRKFAYGRGDRLENQDKIAYIYDAVGNLIEKQDAQGITSRFDYDADNQLVKVVKDNYKVEFQYDAFGRRILKKTDKNSTRFLWDGDVLLCENDAQYLHEGYVPIAKIKDSAVEIYHTDYLGTPKEVTDEKGDLVWQGNYDEYGRVTTVRAETQQHIRFQGQYEDEETGLHYNRFRYYDADGCRYINQDPISIYGGINFYSYTSNPLIWIDPLGLEKIDGGRHRHTKLDGNKNGTESHHLIADAISDLNKNDAPAIRMGYDDHTKTGSHGHQGNKGEAWRTKQEALVKAGNHDAALQMGIDDIKAKFGDKYDAEIKAMKDSLPKKDDGSIDWDKVQKKTC